MKKEKSKNVWQNVKVKKKLIDLEFSSRKEHPSGALFLRVPHALKPMAPRPHFKTYTTANTDAPQVKDWPRWSSAFRRLRAGRTGEGAPSVSRPLLRYIVSPSRKNNLLSRKLSVRIFLFFACGPNSKF